MHILKKLTALVLSAALLVGVIPASAARADSCWNHNGSVMRLVAQGNQRWFYYEVPRDTLRNAGVYPGTLLFNGVKSGNWYSGTARVFSRFCPGQPLEYFVEGPVSANQTTVTVRGGREVHSACQWTGDYTTDVLVFTYMYQC